jgi:hypothetical protein
MSEHEKNDSGDSGSIREREDSTADSSDRDNVCLPLDSLRETGSHDLEEHSSLAGIQLTFASLVGHI